MSRMGSMSCWEEARNIEDVQAERDDDAERPRCAYASAEDDESEVVTKDTTPLPYVQVGMKLVCPDDDAKWWEVREISEDYSRSSDPPTMAMLVSNDIRAIHRDCRELRQKWTLFEDFDPTIDRDEQWD
jgi:hypothetical protein